MESEEGSHVCVNETRKSPALQMPRVFSRLVGLPIVKSACEQVSDLYGRTKDKSLVFMFGFSAAEVYMNAVAVAAKLTYTALPSSGLMGKLKDTFEEKVSQVDTMACDGLEFLENKWPIIKYDKDKIMAVGADKVDQSDLVEVLLTVTEAATDYFIPSQKKLKEEGSADPPVIQTKVDRIRGIRNIFMTKGEKVLSLAASVPGRVTVAGFDGAKTVVLWSLDLTQSLFHQFPVVQEMLAVFCDPTNNGKFFFSPPILGDGRDGLRQKPRRSNRYKAKGDYHRIVDASQPFPVSPDRKRKYDKEEGNDTLIVELIAISNDYVSDEDPNYDPDNDEEGESESSEDDDDEEENGDENGDENENDGQDENDEAEISAANETKAREISPQKAPQPNDAGVEMNGGETVEAKKPPKQNISNKTETGKKETSPAKAAEPNHKDSENNTEGKKVEAKNLVAQESKITSTQTAAENTKKNGGASLVEGRLVV